MLLSNVHVGLDPPDGCTSVIYVSGDYDYYHYGMTNEHDAVSILICFDALGLRTLII